LKPGAPSGVKPRKVALLLALMVVATVLAAGTQVGAWRSPLLVTPDASDGQPGPLRFPANFYWGVAIAGQQAESQQASDWSTFEEDAFRNGRFGTGPALGSARPGHIHDLGKWSPTVRHDKAGFETHYPADLAMAQDMGLNAFRFSIACSRAPACASPTRRAWRTTRR
jgi:hypothetical protein